MAGAVEEYRGGGVGGLFGCHDVADGQPERAFQDCGEHLEQCVTGEVLAQYAVAKAAIEDLPNGCDRALDVLGIGTVAALADRRRIFGTFTQVDGDDPGDGAVSGQFVEIRRGERGMRGQVEPKLDPSCLLQGGGGLEEVAPHRVPGRPVGSTGRVVGGGNCKNPTPEVHRVWC